MDSRSCIRAAAASMCDMSSEDCRTTGFAWPEFMRRLDVTVNSNGLWVRARGFVRLLGAPTSEAAETNLQASREKLNLLKDGSVFHVHTIATSYSDHKIVMIDISPTLFGQDATVSLEMNSKPLQTLRHRQKYHAHVRDLQPRRAISVSVSGAGPND